METAHQNHPSQKIFAVSEKLFAASDDTKKVLTRDDLKQIIKECVAEREESKKLNFNAKILAQKNYRRFSLADLVSTKVILYLGLFVQINSNFQRLNDKFDAIKHSTKINVNIKLTNH